MSCFISFMVSSMFSSFVLKVPNNMPPIIAAMITASRTRVLFNFTPEDVDKRKGNTTDRFSTKDIKRDFIYAPVKWHGVRRVRSLSLPHTFEGALCPRFAHDVSALIVRVQIIRGSVLCRVGTESAEIGKRILEGKTTGQGWVSGVEPRGQRGHYIAY